MVKENRNIPLNSTQSQPRPQLQSNSDGYTFGKLTNEQIQQLADWYIDLADNSDTSKMMPIPDFYRPIAAFMQMANSGIIGNTPDDMKPWNMPAPLVDFFADVWTATRITSLEMHRRKHEESSNLPRSVMFDGRGDPDKGIGRA